MRKWLDFVSFNKVILFFFSVLRQLIHKLLCAKNFFKRTFEYGYRRHSFWKSPKKTNLTSKKTTFPKTSSAYSQIQRIYLCRKSLFHHPLHFCFLFSFSLVWASAEMVKPVSKFSWAAEGLILQTQTLDKIHVLSSCFWTAL